MFRKFKVPTQVLGNQALKTAGLYREDTEANRATLSGIGVTETVVDDAEGLGRDVLDLETRQEMMKTEAALARSASVSANKAVIDWRSIDVMPRARIALDGDSRMAFFRSGKLRSTRASAVIREARITVDTIRMLADDPKLALRGVDAALAKRGEDLIAVAEAEDAKAAQAVAAQVVATQALRKKEEALGSILREIERAAAAVFPADSAQADRYRLKVIRNYIAVHTNTDSKAASPASETQAA
jgi:cell division septum initiation protein DivIVA